MLKEKLGLCPYEVICDEQEFILPEIQDYIKELKKENKESIEIKSPKEPKEIKISKESTEESIEIKSSKENENTTDWFDKNKFQKMLAIVNSNKFDHKNKIGKFKYNDIIELINNIDNNTISQTSVWEKVLKKIWIIKQIKKHRNKR